jgi:hypothetical protein
MAMADEASAQSLLAKLQEFALTLDDAERALLAALIGPGVAQALEGEDVHGFSFAGQESERLARGLAAAYRRDTGSPTG